MGQEYLKQIGTLKEDHKKTNVIIDSVVRDAYQIQNDLTRNKESLNELVGRREILQALY